ncbi:T9SS type A sorting domain-containing protein [Cochleicola gelatinilyticus]|uniref:Uncharacterized protein n=1 Tax=Cochleicola gelatinilyticus TaxID=1763537 RepID=A0A167F6B7_9FLAO|nr:T9SS type A sorting domain-containing protein [Cochleicola gelatinilyticus]OAB76236.1 hypothetical protein ULVI_14035 [Cochleicola gelatinilyticus]
MKRFVLLLGCMMVFFQGVAQSIAREWNEEVLNGIRNDFARPTVHARNLFHSSILMYDLWAVFEDTATPFFLGKQFGNYFCDFEGFEPDESIPEAREKAISYAVYRLMKHRFSLAPGKEEIYESIETLMTTHNYDTSFTSTAYQSGNAAALGNYLAAQLIAFGLQDGSNEANDYANLFYEPINNPLVTAISGSTGLNDPNRWQPLSIENFVDQSGNTIPGGTPEFLSPEWGIVTPFALTEEDLTIHETPEFDFWTYHDPGPPSYIQEGLGIEDPYKWGFALVAAWSSHLSMEDTTMIDISPRNIGNIESTTFPTTFEGFKDFYKYENGGDSSTGRITNPVTGMPYQEQQVLRGNYTRVLAEFWADGPDSETPPGHWFTILNYVNDQPSLIKKFKGQGHVLSNLEWDVKGYFLLGGAMHDAAITAWGSKGYYDYIRPISAIRYMVSNGQSSDPALPNYHPHGMPLIDGFSELIKEDDPLVGNFQENLNKVKLYAWRGPDYIVDPALDIAGVDWILGSEWFPYQRASFVTPPFAGYFSGHSTYSRAAAEILTLLTGTEYFPGGMGVFDIEANSFLKFEVGPTASMQLQWATYYDASDQTSLSRIWGGIHPPIDDIPGRIAGAKIGKDAFQLGSDYFTSNPASGGIIYPNPATDEITIVNDVEGPVSAIINDMAGRRVFFEQVSFDATNRTRISISNLSQGVYFISLVNNSGKKILVKRLLKR